MQGFLYHYKTWAQHLSFFHILLIVLVMWFYFIHVGYSNIFYIPILMSKN